MSRPGKAWREYATSSSTNCSAYGGWKRLGSHAMLAQRPSATPHVNTPPLPDYPSTHSVLGAAAAVMARFFGTDQIAFTMTSGPPFAGITRSFTSLSQAARENADSRVLGGIHFRSACEGGLALGESIGRRAVVQYLQRYQP